MNKKFIFLICKILKYIKQKWKKIFSIFFIILFIILLNIHVGGMFHQSSNDKEKIIIGTHNRCYPLVFYGPETIPSNNEKSFVRTANGEFVSGSDIFLLRDLSKALGKELIIKVYDFAGCISSLQNNQVDAIIGSLDITDQRRKEMEVIPYSNNQLALLLKNNNDIKMQQNNNTSDLSHGMEVSLKDLIRNDNQKIKLSTISGSSHDDSKKFWDYDQNIDIRNMINKEDPIMCSKAIEHNESHAFIMEWPTIEKIISSQENKDKFKGVKLTDKNLNIKPLGIFLPKNDPKKLKEPIEKAIKTIINIPNIDGSEIKALTGGGSLKYFDKYAHETNEAYNYVIEEQQKSKESNFFYKIWHSLPSYKIGFFVSLTVAINSLIIGFILSLIFFSVQLSVLEFKDNKIILFYLKKIFSFFINILSNVFESVPMIVLALLFYNTLTSKSIDVFHLFQDSFKGTFYVAIIVISLNTAINFTNIMLNHNKFLDKGQIEAAYALGLNQKQVFWEIVFSQILRRTMPYMKNQFIINIKETAFFNIIGLINLLWIAQRNISKTYDIFIPFIVVTLVYLILVGIIKIFSKYKLFTKYLNFIN